MTACRSILYKMYIQHYRVITREKALGLLEYQAMPSFRDVAHNGWLCTLIVIMYGNVPVCTLQFAVDF